MNKEPNKLALIYNQTDSKISLETYDEGFFNQSIDMFSIRQLTKNLIQRLMNFKLFQMY